MDRLIEVHWVWGIWPTMVHRFGQPCVQSLGEVIGAHLQGFPTGLIRRSAPLVCDTAEHTVGARRLLHQAMGANLLKQTLGALLFSTLPIAAAATNNTATAIGKVIKKLREQLWVSQCAAAPKQWGLHEAVSLGASGCACGHGAVVEHRDGGGRNNLHGARKTYGCKADMAPWVGPEHGTH